MPTHYREQQVIEAAADDLVAAGKMAPTVPADAVMLLQSRVKWQGDNAFIDGVPLVTALENWCAAAAHRQPPKVDADLDMNNLGDRAKAQRTMRPDLFADLLKAWGLNGPGDTKRGVRPVSANDDGKSKTPDPSNPWSKAGWNVTKQGALIKSIGLDKAAQIAKAAGCKVGDTKPAA